LTSSGAKRLVPKDRFSSTRREAGGRIRSRCELWGHQMHYPKMAVLTAVFLLLGSWTGSAQAAGEKIEENNFPIWRCANSNNWAQYYRKGRPGWSVVWTIYADCTTFKNHKNEKFRIRLEAVKKTQFGNITIRSDMHICKFSRFKTCRRLKTIFIPGNMYKKYKCKFPNHKEFCGMDRTSVKNLILIILRHRNKYWRRIRSQIYEVTGPRRGQTKNVRRGVTLERGYDRPGRAYARYPMRTANGCRVKCARDRHCKAFTYAPGVCYLKSYPYNRVRSPTVTSGKRLR
jgi:hypothetical protein